MNFSTWSDRIKREVGLINLMKDLGTAAASEGHPLYMLGGGNPAHIPEMEKYFRTQMENVMRSPNVFERLVGNYAGPQGSYRFASALANLFKTTYGWDIGPENIAIANGSQTAFTILFRLFSGQFSDGSQKQILLPMTPEYIGYNEADEATRRFVSIRPKIVTTSERTFKYEIDFSNIEITDRIGAICISRPTNPTGNVVSDDEVKKLAILAERHAIPLIVDGAYGLPFPGIIYTEASVEWNENIILSLSLSKLGLPGTRTGIVIAKREVIEQFVYANAIMTLASGNFGSILALNSVASGEILELSQNVIQPHYKDALGHVVETIHSRLANLPYMLHEPQGAFFVWLRFPGLPISDNQLYENLKKRNVYIVPGNYFFPGLDGDFAHRHECMRLSYAGSREVVERGLEIIAEEIDLAYGNSLRVASTSVY